MNYIHSYKEGRIARFFFFMIICRHSRRIASTMLIKLKYSIGDRFASNTLTPFRKIPASERRSPIVMIPLENKSFSNIERGSTVIYLLFQMTCWTTSSYDNTADWFISTKRPNTLYKGLGGKQATLECQNYI